MARSVLGVCGGSQMGSSFSFLHTGSGFITNTVSPGRQFFLLQHASATCSPPVGATGWPSSRIVEGLQWMASFKDWKEFMCFRFSPDGTFIVEGLQWMASFKDWKELMCFHFFS
ncbi:hypothetical protein TNCV_250511 [Trichonephila clavipes]|nr:hypothetical protein TNCV_250511 [Trichonephila clavipes]